MQHAILSNGGKLGTSIIQAEGEALPVSTMRKKAFKNTL